MNSLNTEKIETIRGMRTVHDWLLDQYEAVTAAQVGAGCGIAAKTAWRYLVRLEVLALAVDVGGAWVAYDRAATDLLPVGRLARRLAPYMRIPGEAWQLEERSGLSPDEAYRALLDLRASGYARKDRDGVWSLVAAP